MYKPVVTILKEHFIYKYQIQNKLTQQLLSFQEVLHKWQEDKFFINAYNQILAQSSFPAFFWEHPPMTKNSLEAPYEFVLVKSSSLERVTPEPHTFATYFKNNQSVVSFPNLRGDATLVVPSPQGHEKQYSHLANFVRQAPDNQVNDFWKKVGKIYQKQLGANKKWLSTAGLGVYWLHVRIDSRPKYYRYKPYKMT